MIRDMTFRNKLRVGLLILILVSSASGLIGFYYISAINRTLNEITDITAPTVETSDDLLAVLWEATKVAEEILADEDLADVQTLSAEYQRLDAAFDRGYLELQDLVTDPALLRALRQARSAQEQSVFHTKQMISIHTRELVLELEVKALAEEHEEIGEDMMRLLDQMASRNEAEMQKAEDEGDALVNIPTTHSREINNLLGELFEKDYPVVEAALKLSRLIAELLFITAEYLGEENPEKTPELRKEFEDVFGQAGEHVQIIGELAESPEEKSEATQLSARLEAWNKTVLSQNGLFAKYSQQLTAEYEADRITELLENAADLAAAALNLVADTADAINDAADEKAQDTVNLAATLMITIILLSVVLAVSISYVLTRSITEPLGALLQRIKALASGEFETMNAAIPNTEFGEIVHNFEDMAATITDREKTIRSANKKLETANQEIEKASQAKATFLATMSHEIRTPMNGVIGMVDLIRQSKLTRDQRQMVDTVRDSAHALLTIINDILDFSKIEAGKLDLELVPVSIRNIVESVAENLLPNTTKKDLRLSIFIDPDIPYWVMGDHVRLRQILFNLAGNAVKFTQTTPDKRGIVSIRADCVPAADKNDIWFACRSATTASACPRLPFPTCFNPSPRPKAQPPASLAAQALDYRSAKT